MTFGMIYRFIFIYNRTYTMYYFALWIMLILGVLKGLNNLYGFNRN